MTRLQTLALMLPLLALSACGEEPAPEPAAAQTVAPEPINTLPAPNEALFAKVFAETCPAAEKVSTSICKRAGMGSDEVNCQFGVGEDEHLRHNATLAAADDSWTLANAEQICAEHDSHHVSN